MMEKEFEKYGKKMPYKVPEGFFQEMQEQLLTRADAIGPDVPEEPVQSTRAAQPVRKVHRFRWIMATGIAAALVTAILLWTLPQEKGSSSGMEYLYSYNSDWSEAEMVEMVEMLGNDIFLALDME